jgi:iron complex outermembrane receptor protein
VKSKYTISSAVAAILAAHAGGAALAADAAADASPPIELQEVVVTAQHRVENAQDVPITLQALTAESLEQLNVQNFDEFVKYLPNVTQSTNGPSQGEIFMRGISVGGGGIQGGGTTAAFPGVAIYLDEQSGQLPGRNLDVYAADLERIEVLEGPQGTLFGGGALSGVLRYITNKPKLGETEGSVTAGYGVTAHGDPNTNVTAVLNLPIIQDTLALRGVIYNDREGGYINNLPATFSRSGTDLGLARYNNGVVPTNSVSMNNNNLVANAINPLTYTGARVEALWKLNDDWNFLLTQSYQNMDAQGVFYEEPLGSEGAALNADAVPISGQPLPKLSVNTFNPADDKDKFENSALVVNGEIGPLKAVYAGAYLVRNIEQVQDYTNYARGVYGFYYQCAGYSGTSAAAGQCYTPSTVWREHERNTHQSHELRLSTPEDWRIRGLVGGYWEKYIITDQTQWSYVTVPTCSPTGLSANCFLPIQPWPGSPAYTPTPDTGFFDDVERGYKQLAEFASLDVDIIPKVLTLSGGIRHFKYDSTETGGDVGSFGCKQFAPTNYFGPCQTQSGTDFSTRQTATTNTGNRARGGVSWHFMEHELLYFTWSQGFRAGQFNRTTSCHLPDAQGTNLFCVPATSVPDTVTNVEIGWKTQWLDNRLQFNGTVYQEHWDNAQTQFFDPQGGLGNLAFATNGPSYRVRGFEPQIVALVIPGFTVQAAAAWNSSSQTNSPFLTANNPALLANPATAAEYGKPITSIPNPYGPLGSPTSYSPSFNVSARARYEWHVEDYTPFCQVGFQHQTHMLTATGYVAAFDLPGFTTYDAAIGVGRGQWEVQVYGQNLTNVNTALSENSNQYILAEYPQHPRVLGLKFGYKFSGT